MSQEQETHSSSSPDAIKRTIGPTTVNMSIGTAVVAVIVWAVGEFGGVTIPGEVGLAIAFLVNIFVGWATKPGAGKRRS